jgi:hypothetical protein
MKFLRKLLGKTSPTAAPTLPAPRKPGDPERWQIGDEAECIHDGDWYCRNGFRLTKGAPALGDIFTVQATVIGMPWLFLKFRSSPFIFESGGFRKLPPRDEAAIADLAARIKQGAPAPHPPEPVPTRKPVPVESMQ